MTRHRCACRDGDSTFFHADDRHRRSAGVLPRRPRSGSGRATKPEARVARLSEQQVGGIVESCSLGPQGASSSGMPLVSLLRSMHLGDPRRARAQSRRRDTDDLASTMVPREARGREACVDQRKDPCTSSRWQNLHSVVSSGAPRPASDPCGHDMRSPAPAHGDSAGASESMYH